VVPAFNEEKALPQTVADLNAVLDRLVADGSIRSDSFLYCVDDGSTDHTWAVLTQLNGDNKRVKGLKLARNFGHQAALLAGLLSVNEHCDASISIDADLQQDPDAIAEFVARYKEGADVVFGIRRDRDTDSPFKRTTAMAFYRLMQLMGVSIIPNHADYRLLSRRAMDAIARYPEPDLFLRAASLDVGLRRSSVYFDVVERRVGTSKYSFTKMLRLAINGITSFSVYPLRLIGILGLIVLGLSMAMSLYILVRALWVGDAVPGWASTTLPIYFLGGLQIFCIGVIGEYLAHVAAAVKGRPRFIAEAELA
jgi:glycosyltransferase involved in cell wall biosynthesis